MGGDLEVADEAVGGVAERFKNGGAIYGVGEDDFISVAEVSFEVEMGEISVSESDQAGPYPAAKR